MSTVTEIKALIDDLIDTSSSNFTDAKKARLMNKAQDKIVNLIIRTDYEDQYDDENYTDISEGFLSTVSGTADYSFKEDENLANVLYITKVRMKDSTGTWQLLTKTKSFIATKSGMPTQYRIVGKTILFDITPDFSSAAGIKIEFVRIPVAISTSDTSKEVGLPTTFHHLLALHVCYDYARSKRMDNRNDLMNEILMEEKNLGLFISSKDKAVVNRLKANVESCR